MLIMVIYLEST